MRLFKYAGPRLWIALKLKRSQRFYSKFTGNQCCASSTGVIWQYLGVWVISRAAEFWSEDVAIWKDAQLVRHREDRCNNQCVPWSRLVQAIWWRLRGQELPYLSDIMQVKVDWLTRLVNLFCHLKVNVKPRTKVADGRTYNWHCCLTNLYCAIFTRN